MKVYLDLIFFMNFFYDYSLLLTLSFILKRKVDHKRLFLASLLGSLSILIMIFNKTDVLIISIIISLLMVIISFKYISYRYTLNNIVYLYMLSIILAGFLYYLRTNFSHVNTVLMIIISPVILYLEYYMHKNSKDKYNDYYQLEIVFGKETIKLMAFFDNGNDLTDPIFHMPVIIIEEKYLKKISRIRSPVLVPYHTINATSIMKCYKPSYMLLNNKKIVNYLVGGTCLHFKDGVGGLLNNHLRKDNYV